MRHELPAVGDRPEDAAAGREWGQSRAGRQRRRERVRRPQEEVIVWRVRRKTARKVLLYVMCLSLNKYEMRMCDKVFDSTGFCFLV